MKTGMKTAALVLALVLLACALPAAMRDSENVTGNIQNDESANSQNDESADSQDGSGINIPDTIGEPAEDPANAGIHLPVMLPEKAGIKGEYLPVLGFDDGERKDIFRFTNGTEDMIDVSLKNFVLNGTIHSDEEVYCILDGNVQQEVNAQKLTQMILMASGNQERLGEITCDMEISSWADENGGDPKVLFSGPVELPVVGTDELALFCEPACGMRADEQTLLNDKGVQVRLLGCGKYFGSYSAIEGILEISNQSERIIPYSVNGIRINGMFFDVYAGGSAKLAPDKKRICTFNVTKSDLEDAGITSITDVSLLILTSHDQNTGAVGYGGGEWYDLDLAEKGDEEQAFDEGTVIYEDEWVRIGLRNATANWHDGSEGSRPYGYCYWNLAITNKSEENLEIGSEAETINGEEAEDDVFLLGETGKNAGSYAELTYMMKEDMELPEISFRVCIYKQGRGTLLHQSAEMVTILPDGTVRAPES